MKHQSWEGNASGKNPDRYRLEDDDTITCLGGKKGTQVKIPGRHPRNEGDVFYRIDGCTGCPFSAFCKRWNKDKEEDFKIFEVGIEKTRYKQQAEQNLLSPKGIEMRVNRSCQVEGEFGIVKQDMGYDRFRRTLLPRVSAEFMLTFLGANIRKLFRHFEGTLKTGYWKAPENLKPERIK